MRGASAGVTLQCGVHDLFGCGWQNGRMGGSSGGVPRLVIFVGLVGPSPFGWMIGVSYTLNLARKNFLCKKNLKKIKNKNKK